MYKNNPKPQKRTPQKRSSTPKSPQHSSKAQISSSFSHSSHKSTISTKSNRPIKTPPFKHTLSPSSISSPLPTAHTLSATYLTKTYISPPTSSTPSSFSQPPSLFKFNSFHPHTQYAFHKRLFSSTKAPPASPNEICDQLLEMEAQLEGITIEMLTSELQSENPSLDLTNPSSVIHAITEHNMRHADHHPNSHSFRYNEEQKEIISKSTMYTPTSNHANKHVITKNDAELVTKLITLTEPDSRMLFDDTAKNNEDPQVYFAKNRHIIIDPPGYKDGLPIIDSNDDATPVPISQRQDEHRFQKVEEKIRDLPPILHYDPPAPSIPPHLLSESGSTKH